MTYQWYILHFVQTVVADFHTCSKRISACEVRAIIFIYKLELINVFLKLFLQKYFHKQKPFNFLRYFHRAVSGFNAFCEI